jgi:hypothetical protein
MLKDQNDECCCANERKDHYKNYTDDHRFMLLWISDVHLCDYHWLISQKIQSTTFNLVLDDICKIESCEPMSLIIVAIL